MSAYALVLSDQMYELYYNFKHGKNTDPRKTERLLNLLQEPVLTNTSQLERLNINDKGLISTLGSNGFINQTLKELSKLTLYKIILSEEKNLYPYVNIAKDSVRTSFTMTFMPTESREKAHSFIKAQLKNANSIFLYDKYFTDNWNDTELFFTKLMPKKSVNVFYVQGQLAQNHIARLKNICKQWTFKIDNKNISYANLHDRYLIIDSELEIVLTSGFSYLFSHDKECTVIFRKI